MMSLSSNLATPSTRSRLYSLMKPSGASMSDSSMFMTLVMESTRMPKVVFRFIMTMTLPPLSWPEAGPSDFMSFLRSTTGMIMPLMFTMPFM